MLYRVEFCYWRSDWDDWVAVLPPDESPLTYEEALQLIEDNRKNDDASDARGEYEYRVVPTE